MLIYYKEGDFMTLDQCREILYCNDVSFFYKGREFFILQGTNSCIVGEYHTDNDLVFDKYKGLDENITDMLEHWKIDDTCFKDIVKEIEF